MKKILITLFILSGLIIPQLYSQSYLKSAGPYILFAGDTLATGKTLTYANTFIIPSFQYLHAWIKSTNPAESTKYRIFYKFALSPTDAFSVPNDTNGAEISSTIMNIGDTLHHYIGMELPDAIPPYMKVYVTSDGSDHGNRCRVWLKLYFTKDY